MIYEIKRGSVVVAAVRASGQQFKSVMSEDRVEMEFSLPSPVTFQIGDTVEVYGQTYKINRPSNIGRRFDKIGFTYQLEFEALYYDLGKWELKTLDKDNQLTESEVYMMSDAATMIDLIVRNANRVSSGWTVGAIEATEVMQFGYSNTKLLTVLQDLADKYNLEFWVTGKQINFGRNQASSGLTWEYGKANELYELRRDRSDIPVINRLTVLGGTRNLPADYGHRRLQPTDGNPITVTPVGDVVEQTVTFDNIYPHRVGTVSHVTGLNTFRDTSLDFNVNNYEIGGTVPRVAFISGQLAGFTFELSRDGYVHANRQITIDSITDDPGYPSNLPSVERSIQVGDKYVLLDIFMPPSYVAAEEAKLQDIGEQYLEDYKVSHYNWSASLKPKYVLEDAVELVLGNTVRVVDTPLGIDTNIRISGFTRDLQEPYRYEVSLSNIITVSELVSQRNAQDRLAYTIQRSGLADGTSSETLQSVTRRGSVTDRAITVRGTRNTHLLGVPQAAPLPEDVVAGETYFWFGSPGSGSTPPPAYGNLEDLQNVADLIDNGKYLYKSGGQWVGVDITMPDLSSYAQIGTGAGQVRNNTQLDARYAPVSHTHTIAQVTGLQSQLDGFAVRAADNNFTARNHFSGALSIPQSAPASPVAGQAYVWFGEPGTGSGGGVEISNLEDLQNVADVIADGKYLRKVSGEWQGVDITFPDLSSYAPKAWVTAGFAPIVHTHSISQITGLQTQLDGKAAISHTHNASDINAGTLGIARIPTGTTSSTVAIGNDSRIVNGQTAYGWGNHGLAGYAVRAANNNFTARNHFSGALAIPQSAPSSPVAGQAYVWFGAPGSGSGGGTSGTLAGLDDVAWSSLANNQLIRYNSSTGKWVNFTANYAAASHTHPISQITGLQSALDGKEPAFSKNTGFNRSFGTTANTVAQGNDSRIVNGQTAYGWGNHTGLYLPLEGGALTGNLRINTYLNIVRAANSYRFEISGTGFGDYNNIYLGRSDNSTGLYYGSGHQIWHAGNLSVGNGTLSLSTGAGLTGSASFSANQSGNTSFSISVASGYVLPTTGQVTNWNTAYGWGDYRGFGLGVTTLSNISNWNTYVPTNTTFVGDPSRSTTGKPLGFTGYAMGLSFQRALNIASVLVVDTRTGNLATMGIDGSGWTDWRHYWHNGNIDPVPTSRQIITGNHLDGGGNLASNRTLSVAFTTNTYVMDSLGNPRIYFSHNTTTNDMIFRLSQSNGRFAFRNANNSERMRIESDGKIYSYAGIESAGKITCPVIEPSAIIVPSAAPSSPESGKRYIWFS